MYIWIIYINYISIKKYVYIILFLLSIKLFLLNEINENFSFIIILKYKMNELIICNHINYYFNYFFYYNSIFY